MWHKARLFLDPGCHRLFCASLGHLFGGRSGPDVEPLQLKVSDNTYYFFQFLGTTCFHTLSYTCMESRGATSATNLRLHSHYTAFTHPVTPIACHCSGESQSKLPPNEVVVSLTSAKDHCHSSAGAVPCPRSQEVSIRATLALSQNPVIHQTNMSLYVNNAVG